MTNPQLWNRYAYALNGPLRYSDPSGLKPQEEPEPEMVEYGLTGFDPVAFQNWADRVMLVNIISSYAAGRIGVDQLMAAFPDGFRAHVAGIVAASTVAAQVGGFFREAAFAYFGRISNGRLGATSIPPL